MLTFSQLPASVLNERACAMCWRPFGGGTQYRQTLDGVSRSLCLGCLSRLYPKPPKGADPDSQVVELDAGDLVAEAEARFAATAPWLLDPDYIDPEWSDELKELARRMIGDRHKEA